MPTIECFRGYQLEGEINRLSIINDLKERYKVNQTIGMRKSFFICQPAIVAWVAVMLLALLLLSPGNAGAQTSIDPFVGKGSIRGMVEMGSAGITASLSSLPVTLTAFTDGRQIGSPVQSRTDSHGAFRFSHLNRDATLRFQVAVSYENVTYRSALLSILPDTNTVPVTVTVYASTDTAPAIHIYRLHWILNFSPIGLQVAEYYILDNPSDRTYIGQPLAGVSGRAVLRLPLPANAKAVRFVDNGASGHRFQQVHGMVIDTLPLPPGEQVRRVLFRYTVPYGSFHTTLKHFLPYPATQVILVVPKLGERIKSSAFQEQGEHQIDGKPFAIWNTKALPAGEQIAVSFANIPGRPPIAIKPLAIAVGVLVFFVALLVGWYGSRHQRRPPQPVDVAARREELLMAIARLDDQYEKGALDMLTYQQERGRYKHALAQIWGEGRGRD